MLRRGYGISEEAGARLARGNKMAKSLAKGYVAVFDSQLKFGLRFPILQQLKDVIDDYEVSITQMFPLGLCGMVNFEMACKEAKVKSNLNLFRHYYNT